MSNQAERIALILKAIEDEEREFSEERTAHKDRMERLHNAAYKLRGEILGGQMQLVPEPEPVKGTVTVSPEMESSLPGITQALREAGFKTGEPEPPKKDDAA